MTTWTVTEVSQASGLSEGTISGYFSNRGISTKGGLTLNQVLEVISRANKRDHGVNDTDKVKTLVHILEEAGVETPYTLKEGE